jgi:transposase
VHRLQHPELLTLAHSIDTWWPQIDAFITTGITNARTEGHNRLVKQVKRAGCGYRNPTNSTRRIRFHCTRKQRARNPDLMLIARSKLKSQQRTYEAWSTLISMELAAV